MSVDQILPFQRNYLFPLRYLPTLLAEWEEKDDKIKKKIGKKLRLSDDQSENYKLLLDFLGYDPLISFPSTQEFSDLLVSFLPLSLPMDEISPQGINPAANFIKELKNSGKNWGILTNGISWRLYNLLYLPELDTFFEANLLNLSMEDKELFRLYSFLFLNQNFEKRDGKLSLADEFLEKVEKYRENLKKEFQYRLVNCLHRLINGFFNYKKNNLKADKSLDSATSASLCFLARIIIIYLMEQKGFLPLSDPDYLENYSLTALIEEIHKKKVKGRSFLRTKALFWAHIKTLIEIINDGAISGFNAIIPPFFAFLFRQNESPFLDRYEICDADLEFIFHTIFYKNDKERLFLEDLNYPDIIDLFHSIYNFRAKIARESFFINYQKGKIYPTQTLCEDREAIKISPGEVYLNWQPKELTPQKVLKYRTFLYHLLAEYALSSILEKKSSPQEILSMKILDPYMQEGDFLIAALNEITLNLWTKFPAPVEKKEVNSLYYWLRRAGIFCIYGLTGNKPQYDLSRLNFILHTAHPSLPFLWVNHRLRLGNTLIGTQLKYLQSPPDIRKHYFTIKEGQRTIIEELFSKKASALIRAMNNLLEGYDQGKDDLDRRLAAYESSLEEASCFTLLANCWVSFYFEGGVSLKTYNYFLEKLLHSDSLTIKDLDRPSLTDHIQPEYLPFHFELAFPEIYFDEQGFLKPDPGFDLILSSLPSEKASHLVSEQNFFLNHFEVCYGPFEMAILFFEKAYSLLNHSGRCGFLTSNKYLVSDFGLKLRKFLYDKNLVEMILEIFTDSKLGFKPDQNLLFTLLDRQKKDKVSIGILKRFEPVALLRLLDLLRVKTSFSKEDEYLILEIRDYKELQNPYSGHFNIYFSGKRKGLVKKLYQGAKLLADEAFIRTAVVSISPERFNESIIESKKPKINFAKVLSLKLIDKWCDFWGKKSMVLYNKNYLYPRINYTKIHLSASMERIITSKKILVRGIAPQLTATLDMEGMGILTNIHSIIPHRLASGFILALLNSKLFNWLHLITIYSGKIKSSQLHYPISFLKRLPIKNISLKDEDKDKCLNLNLNESPEHILSMAKEAMSAKPADTSFIYYCLNTLSFQVISLVRKRMDLIHLFNLNTLPILQQNLAGLNSYPFLNFDAVEIALKLNSLSVDQIASHSALFLEQIEELLKFKNSLCLLNEQISQWESLMDKIIFILYQLTEEEVELINEQYTIYSNDKDNENL